MTKRMLYYVLWVKTKDEWEPHTLWQDYSDALEEREYIKDDFETKITEDDINPNAHITDEWKIGEE